MTELHTSTVNLHEAIAKLRSTLYPKSAFQVVLTLVTGDQLLVDEIVDAWQDAMVVVTERTNSKPALPILVMKDAVVTLRVSTRPIRRPEDD